MMILNWYCHIVGSIVTGEWGQGRHKQSEHSLPEEKATELSGSVKESKMRTTGKKKIVQDVQQQKLLTWVQVCRVAAHADPPVPSDSCSKPFPSFAPHVLQILPRGGTDTATPTSKPQPGSQ